MHLGIIIILTNFYIEMSISNSSINETDDQHQEDLIKFDEMNLLGLERIQQTMGSVSTASFNMLGQERNEVINNCEQTEASDWLIEIDDQRKKPFCEKCVKLEMELKDTKQMCIIKELEKKTLQSELKQKELVMENLALQTKVTKMEQQELRQNQKEDEQGKYVSADQISQLQCRINELEKQLKEERRKKEDEKEKYVPLNQFNTILEAINELAKQQKMAQKQQNSNCWDVNACHNDLKIVDANCLAVNYKGNGKGWRTVLAEHSIRKTNYFEILVKQMKSFVLTGFSFRQQTQLDEAISMCMGTYAYSSSGNFWIVEYWNGIKEKTEFGTGDIVGCGIHLTTRQIFFTKNGQRMDSANLFAPPSLAFDLLFPCVTLVDSDDLIEANFGPDFLFNVATL